MDCEKYKDMISEQFGLDDISEDLKSHLEQCPECADLYESLRDIETSISDEKIFALDEAELNRMVNEVDGKLDRFEEEKVTVLSPLWKSFIPAAAAVLLIVGVGSMTNLFNFGSGVVVDTASTSGNLTIAESYDADAYGEILDGYLTQSNMAAADLIFEDITDEELEYLEKNFDLGDIL